PCNISRKQLDEKNLLLRRGQRHRGLIRNGHTLEFMCKKSYTIISPSVRKCADGNLTLPTCTSGEIGSEMSIPGDNSSEKLPPLTWDPPTEVACTAPQIDNGNFLPVRNKYKSGDVIHASCYPGYILKHRDDSSVCTKYGWSPSIKCISKRCAYPHIVNGALSWSNIYYSDVYFPKEEGQTIHFKCNRGFLPENKKHWHMIRCTKFGWDPKPKCFKKCSQPPRIQDGDFLEPSQKQYLTGAKMTYKCQRHYVMRGSPEVRCEKGNWTEAPVCLVPCTITGEEMDHNHIHLKWSNERKLYVESGDVVEFACQTGYRPDPSSHVFRAYCTKGTLEYPRCIVVQIVCLSPHVEHGDFRPKAVRYQYEDPIEIVCDAGFQSSALISRCTEQGWQPPAKCIPKNCGYIQIQNGNFYYNENPRTFPRRLGSQIHYRCNSGFLPPEKTYYGTFRCTRSGWDPEPKCLKKCEHRSPLRNGKFIYSYWNSFIEGDPIFYSCNEGYHPANKNASVTCTKDGWSPPPKCVTWQELLPSCKNDPPLHGFFVNPKTKFSLNEKVAYGCQSGFTTKERHERGETQCLEDGWRPEPKCIKTCPKPAEENANFPSSKTTYLLNDILSYECKDGFQTVTETSEGQTQCTENGWDPNPVCLPIECEGLSLENGLINKRQDKYVNGEVIQFSCLKKYKRVGPDSAQCYYFGWYPQPPICKATVKPCVQPNSTIPHGSADGVLHEEYQHGEKVVYECNVGFAMTGSNTIECVDGKWTSLPSCTGKSLMQEQTVYRDLCADKPFPIDLYIGEHWKWRMSINFHNRCKCFPLLYNLSPMFKSKLLDVQYHISHTANYSCHSGSYATKCVHGKWPPELLCPELCPPPPQIPNAVKITEMRNYRSGEEVSFTCMEHFVRKGPQKITCEGGRWQTPPRCVDKRCGDPPPIPHGEAKSGASRKYDPGETVEYISAVKVLKLMDQVLLHVEIWGGLNYQVAKVGWRQFPKSPYLFISSTHSDANCREPPVVDNADIVEERAEPYQPGHELHYQCHEGFEISGSNTIRCENKVWSTLPKCEDATCPPPPAVLNGRINGHRKAKYMPLEKVSYRCDSPYSLFGPATTMCLKKEWTDIPECKVAGGRCDRPPSIDNGDILEMAKSEYMSGEKVHYKCQNLYRMEGTAEVECHNGHWTQPPTCIAPCTASEDDMKINNIRLRWRGDPKVYSESGDRVEFACRSGYDPDPSSPPFAARCVDGRFEYPRCIRQLKHQSFPGILTTSLTGAELHSPTTVPSQHHFRFKIGPLGRGLDWNSSAPAKVMPNENCNDLKVDSREQMTEERYGKGGSTGNNHGKATRLKVIKPASSDKA
ncbi:hypothetical protein JRQ81_014561, partial [Phrynocephalus forsythii]